MLGQSIRLEMIGCGKLVLSGAGTENVVDNT